MATDLAIDRVLGDLESTVSNDVALVTGQDEVEQRMRIRLRTTLGAWLLRPTFGSTLVTLLRDPTDVALSKVPLVVKEALAPIEDIQVNDVVAQIDPDHASKIVYVIVYQIVGSDGASDQITYSDSITVTT